ncbi:hypothetical protein SpCBS45565_g06364 [Spizellomyces sp. 'palustris']|nr:hypothetical protein SpCBS45565_g06364 [Spizellomyces sp. 'palustris']
MPSPSAVDNLRKRTAKRPTKHSKTKLINEAVAAGNLEALRTLAASKGGFVNHSIRRKVWPLLLHSANKRRETFLESADEQRDASQIALDVNRSLAHVLQPDTGETRLETLRKELSNVLLTVLSRHSYLHYYQGFHDVASVLLLVLKPKLASACLEPLALFYLRDFMAPSLQSSMNQISLLFPLIALVSPATHDFLSSIEGFLPYFCLSWVITWYSHDIDDLSQIARLFDFLIASNPLMPVYLAAAVVLSQNEQLVELEHEYSTVHHFLSKFPPDANLEMLIKQANNMYNLHPPEAVQKSARLPLGRASVVNRFKVDFERLPLTQEYDDQLPQKLLNQHVREVEKPGGHHHPHQWLLENARHLAWISAFAATSVMAWYAYQTGYT